MARMIPESPPTEGGGARAEAALHRALAHHLSDDWYVYGNVDFVDRDGAQEGEADFLCVHRTRGILLIECKGRSVRRRADGKWARGGGRPMRRGPMKQAQDAIKALGPELGRRWAKVSGAARLPFVTGHAVAFPLTRRRDLNLPLDWNDLIFFDADALADIGAQVEAAMDFWSQTAGEVHPLGEADMQRFRARVLHPQLELVPSLGARLELDRQQMVRLSDEQRAAVESFIDNPRVNVQGGAGTGKTVLAVEAACQLAEQGERTVLLCFNRGLADHLFQAVRDRGEPGHTPYVVHFHALCFKAAAALDRTLTVPKDVAAQREFWRVEAPFVLLEAIEAGRIGGYDALVVDEGQDFAPDWWTVVHALLRDPEGGRRIIFHDPAQAIFGRAHGVPTAPTFKLTRNFRNTRAVAQLLGRLSETTALPHKRAPQGEEPTLLDLPRRRDLLRMLDERVTGLVARGVRPGDIALLTPHSQRKSSLADRKTVGGCPLVPLGERREDAVTHATISGFKGLEAEVVFLLDVIPDDPRCDRAARYVGASRARSLLFTFSKGRFDAEPTA